MSDRLVRLYFLPASFYSQRALIALHEKGVKFEPVIVDIHSGEQHEPSYMRISPKGLVPALQDGEKIITESENIVDYVDREFPGDTKLVPDASTEIGKETSKWRKILDALPIDQISFGVLCHPQLSVTGLKVPSYLLKKKTDIIAGRQITAKKLEQLADEHPDLRDAYTAKSAECLKFVSKISSQEKAEKVLEDLETTLDEVEEQLKKVDADPSKELWFCGQQFTAADINLCILLARLDMLGIGQRYHTADKRSRLHAYWESAKKRPTVRRVSVNAMREMVKLKMKQKAKILLPIVGGLVTLGLAAGLAFVFAQKR